MPTVYLWLADAYAIANGIWEISPTHTLGLRVGPLPLEEAVFFLITNVLVVQGLVLFLDRRAAHPGWIVPPPPSARWRDERSRRRALAVGASWDQMTPRVADSILNTFARHARGIPADERGHRQCHHHRAEEAP